MALPSFIELMASLGLEQQSSVATTIERSPSPQPRSTPSSSPRSVASLSLPARSSSTPSLKEMTARHRAARYSPYYSGVSFTRRRDSISSNSSASDFEASPISATFITAASSRARRYRNKLSVNTYYDSSSDLAADTPISTYVRRKTPGTSPTSPTFARDSGYESSSSDTMPFSIPSLPVLFPQSASSESFPNTPTDVEMAESLYPSPKPSSQPLSDITEGTNRHFVRRHTGTRISNAPRSSHFSDPSNYLTRRKLSFEQAV